MRTESLSSPLRRTGALIATLVLGLGVAGCGGSAESSEASTETRSFEAENGTVEIPVNPERVVATGYAVPALLEADAPLVGISEWSRGTNLMTDEDLATYEELEKVAGETADSTNYEKVLEVEPDLIVIGVPMPVLGDLDMERLEKIAPVVVLGPALPDSWTENTRLQADAAGVLGNFDETKAAYEKKAAALKEKFAPAIKDLKFGHLGGYGDVGAGSFHREFAGSHGTNILDDIGVNFYGQVKNPGEGSAEVSELPAIEELPASFGEADVITYTLEDDGTAGESVKYAMNSPLWKQLPAVEDGKAIGIRYTAAATYESAMKTLDDIDQAFSKAFADEL